MYVAKLRWHLASYDGVREELVILYISRDFGSSEESVLNGVARVGRSLYDNLDPSPVVLFMVKKVSPCFI